MGLIIIALDKVTQPRLRSNHDMVQVLLGHLLLHSCSHKGNPFISDHILVCISVYSVHEDFIIPSSFRGEVRRETAGKGNNKEVYDNGFSSSITFVMRLYIYKEGLTRLAT